MVAIPRVVIAAAASGQGKTSIATGLLGAFRARGRTVSPHKVGPDYIDPGYHGLAAGRPGRNLDPWLVGEERIVPLFVHGATTPTTADLAIVEGVMGLFDGATGLGEYASTAHIARLLQAPVILVVDGSGVGRSVAALVHGFATFDPAIRIGGVIFNRVGTPRHEQILREAVESVGVPVLGAVYRQEALAVPSRHLGLIPAAERTAEATATVAVLADVVGASVDLAAIEQLAATAPALETPAAAERPATRRTLIAVAGGAAFTFGYAEQAELLSAAGAEVVTVDPLRDEALPAGTAGLVIGGGFPEVHADELSANVPLRRSISALAASGAPVAAECAGLLYLARSLDGRPMCGVLDVEAQMTPRLSLGYREAVATSDSVLAAAGTRVRGHEFHRTSCTPAQAPAWRWQGPAGAVDDGAVASGVHASYLHLHWAGNPGMAERFVAATVPA
ncbi:cobyrinate a,c-diamide synthase [Jatrophihabitans sp.]|uniref:cobyrinate a,c-diamide synthase n=1 Tax=Jatrophihabitans sp. TaxID=1932789 RepID=UPI0030C76430|nr:cobyrinic acid a,c-diamide synthase [Jatrophihabitans sp.]